MKILIMVDSDHFIVKFACIGVKLPVKGLLWNQTLNLTLTEI